MLGNAVMSLCRHHHNQQQQQYTTTIATTTTTTTTTTTGNSGAAIVGVLGVQTPPKIQVGVSDTPKIVEGEYQTY